MVVNHSSDSAKSSTRSTSTKFSSFRISSLRAFVAKSQSLIMDSKVSIITAVETNPISKIPIPYANEASYTDLPQQENQPAFWSSSNPFSTIIDGRALPLQIIFSGLYANNMRKESNSPNSTTNKPPTKTTRIFARISLSSCSWTVSESAAVGLSIC